MMQADGNYSINPWMRPEIRLGDNIDPSPIMDGEGLVEELVAINPPAPSAGYTPRETGLPRDQPTVLDVLNVGPSILQQDKDMGYQSTLRPASGDYT